MTDPMVRIRACLVCVRNDEVLCIELADPLTGQRFWSVPGGEIEAGEAADAAAVRETLEETGYRTIVHPGQPLVTRYPFLWNGRHVDCETSWFLGSLSSPDPAPVSDESYLLGCAWIPRKALAELLSTHPPILLAVQALLDR
jgi:8-oxo-dGTP diphosphatase